MIDERKEKQIADYCAGTISRADFGELRMWLDTDPQNTEGFANYLKAYKCSRAIALLGQMDETAAWRDIAARLRRRKRRPLLHITAAAAAVALLLSIPLFLLDRRDDTTTTEFGQPGRSIAVLQLADGQQIALDGGAAFSFADGEGALIAGVAGIEGMLVYETGTSADEETTVANHSIHVPVGGEFGVLLADGTRVRLNSDTRLRYPTRFTGQVREIYVEGEAYLEVAHDPARPFIVRTSDATIEVLGTAFNVSAYPSDRATTTTLVSGKLAVASSGQRSEIMPGQQAIVRAGETAMTVRAVDTRSYVSWIDGVFEFEDMPLGEICARLSRWYGVEFEFACASYADKRFTGGTWKYVPLGDFLQVMEKTAGITFDLARDGRVIVNSQ
ncbi:MAG: FecR domain-containing protein [Rikenellaceae bacterium]|nr:FecR domain-containing protein [Rikenellaceae bacterium]MCL2693096.1 FecR domain-containing protein [Rikenellaceae bacterium]